MDFALIDESTAATAGAANGGTLTPTALAQMAAALQVYANRDVGFYWGGSHRVRASSGPSDVQAGEVVCAIVDALPDAPGAVAYHDVNGAEVPTVFLAKSQCNSLISGPDSVSSALSHEVAEAIGDPACNRWVDDGSGTEHALEVADPCQEWGYEILGVTCSDFVLAAYFAPGASPPYNYLATQTGGPAISAPLALAPGGYQIERTAGTGETQVTGKLDPRRLARKSHPTSRTYRRGWRGKVATT